MSYLDLQFGDCLELMPKLDDRSVSMIFADLPFGTTPQSWDKIINMELLWKEYHRVIKDNGAIVLFAKPPFDKVLCSSNLKNYRYDWIWEKTRATGHLNANKMPLQAHENICVFYKKLPTYNPQKTTGHKPVNSFYTRHNGECYGSSKVQSGGGNTDRYPRSVLRYAPVPNKERLHPNQKPVELLKHQILTYTNEGDVVLDNTMGVGSTGEACFETARDFIGMEKGREFFGKAKTRMRRYSSAA